jgi:predicted TIM-barrel fold metal-dependent hydrolase
MTITTGSGLDIGATLATGPRRSTGLLPDPEPQPRHFTIVSCDDHLVEPRDCFEGRLPRRLADRAPRVVTEADGTELWDFDGRRHPQIGLNAVVGRPKPEWTMEPARFDEMRPGCWDIEARIRDMDLDGVQASVCFPSLIAGFAGARFSEVSDPELGLACVKAWNDWHIEEWAGPHPDRIIPLQIPWLQDPELAAAEVRRNAARGFKAVSFPENPVDLGFPSVHTAYWDPFLRACEETQTVVCLHTGSSSWTASRSPEAPYELYTTLFPVNALVTTADWLWSGVPVRFPELRLVLDESGIGWVPMLIDRIDYVMDHSAATGQGWKDPVNSPTEVLRRNFRFGIIDITSAMRLRDHIGIETMLLESDYPHADSTWPDTQARANRGLDGLSAEELRAITWGNASALFRHPVPPELQLP